ncbi:precursor of CEP6-like [Olea europaea var. sylvestris]|uniref:precursor of CEP6-like n=1 Tax=Olea europaea var. sylvestris TaxID=158386 RepID=UPI000C1D8B8A|nr:precursor of CEP6-like [Olea europaea var. sylvestris]
MAYIQNISMFLFLLAGFSCLQISLTEARQLKPFKKQEKHDFSATLPANASLQIVGQKRIPPPTNQKHEIDSSHAMGVNDFRPTSPGKSPGIGHSSPAQKDNAGGNTDVFRPTGPGHSPGIGHSFANKTTGPNA